MKNKIIVISYATKEYEIYQKKLNKSAKKYGADKVISYNPNWLYSKKKDFVEKNKILLKKKRGAGYWIWKPLIIYETLRKVNEGDFVVYLDAGVEVINDLKILTKICKKEGGFLIFKNLYKNKEWTKRDCFIKMGCDSKKYWESYQCAATYQIYQKNKKVMNFIEEYLNYCQDPLCVSDEKNVLGKPNLPGFIEHRHDQSILTNLVIKHRIRMYPEPSQWGNHLKKPYPQMFNLHRGPKGEQTFIKRLHSHLPEPIKLLIKRIRKKLRDLNLIR